MQSQHCSLHACLLQALQLLNTEYAQAARYLEQARAEHASLDGVQFPIGEFFPYIQQSSACAMHNCRQHTCTKNTIVEHLHLLSLCETFCTLQVPFSGTSSTDTRVSYMAGTGSVTGS